MTGPVPVPVLVITDQDRDHAARLLAERTPDDITALYRRLATYRRRRIAAEAGHHVGPHPYA